MRGKLASLGPLLDTDNDADGVIETIEKWLHSIDMPTDLKDFGIQENEIQQIEDYSLEDPCCPSNPRKVEKGDVVQILKNLL